MTKKYDIATTMNSIMASPGHQAVFAKPQPQFQKTAAKKDAEKGNADKAKECAAYCRKLMKEADCGGSVKVSGGKVVVTCPDPKIRKKCKAHCKKMGVECEIKEPKNSKAGRYQAAVIGLAKISEYLDAAGLEKEAAYTLIALDGLVRNAMPTGKAKETGTNDCGMADDKDDDDKDEKDDDKKGKGKGKGPPWLKDKKKDDDEEDEDDEDENDADTFDYGASHIQVPMDYITGTPPGGAVTGPGAGRAPAPKLHPQDPGLDVPDSYLINTNPNDPLNPWLGGAPSPEVIDQIMAARKAYRAARAAGGDDSLADTSDVIQAPAEEGGWEQIMSHLNFEPEDFPQGEQWLKEVDEEMGEEGEDEEEDLRSKMDEEDDGSFLEDLINEELEGVDLPETGTEAVANKKLTSLQKVARELKKARRPF